jgi:hypothetical protein
MLRFIAAAATYISEVAPTEIRGKVLSFYQLFCESPLVGYVQLATFAKLGVFLFG